MSGAQTVGVPLDRLAADARAALGSAGEVIGAAPGSVPGVAPRYELFGGANSICSQKVRAVLAHHGLPYVSHAVNMFEGQTYLPGYVRLRMEGCRALGGDLVAEHTGSTSAQAGCDGAVVPTLIDWTARAVLVDSKRICIVVDGHIEEPHRLCPGPLIPAIEEELAIVDNLPNYQMLMGRQVAASEAGTTRSDVGGTFSRRKVAWCDRYLEERAGDDVLVAAYTAKRAKELSAAEKLFSPEAMQVAYGRVERALEALEHRLARSPGQWLFGAEVTMADLFWGIELLRMRNMGVATYWEGGRLPETARFLAQAEELPALRTAVLHWPGAMF